MTNSINKGGIVEFCERLRIDPSVIFADTRKNGVRLIKGMLFILMKREGYKVSEIELIFRTTGEAINRSIAFAEKQLRQRSPIAVEAWGKVKLIQFYRQTDVRKTYEKELAQIGFTALADGSGVLINSRLKEDVILDKTHVLKEGIAYI